MPALTRPAVEAILVGADGRSGMAGRLAALVGLYDPDAEGFAVGSLPALDEPIAAALRMVGVAVGHPGIAGTADLANLPDADVGEFLDRLKLRLVEHALANWDMPDEQAGTDARQDWGKLLAIHRQAAADWRAHVLATWGPPGSAGGLVPGRIDLQSREPWPEAIG